MGVNCVAMTTPVKALAVHPVIYTRETLLAAAGFKPVQEVRRALARTRQALDAVRPARRTTTTGPDGVTVKVETGGAPDWPVRLHAAELTYEVADVRRATEEDRADLARPIAIALILTATDGGAPRAALPTDGLRVHLAGGDGL